MSGILKNEFEFSLWHATLKRQQNRNCIQDDYACYPTPLKR